MKKANPRKRIGAPKSRVQKGSRRTQDKQPDDRGSNARAEQLRSRVVASRLVRKELLPLITDAEWTTDPREPDAGKEAIADLLALHGQLERDLIREARAREAPSRGGRKSKRGVVQAKNLQGKRFFDEEFPVARNRHSAHTLASILRERFRVKANETHAHNPYRDTHNPSLDTWRGWVKAALRQTKSSD